MEYIWYCLSQLSGVTKYSVLTELNNRHAFLTVLECEFRVKVLESCFFEEKFNVNSQNNGNADTVLFFFSAYLLFMIFSAGFNTEPVYGCQVVYCWALLPTQDVANVILKLVIFLICLIPFHICLPMWTNLDNYFSYKIDNNTERIPPSSYTCPDVKSEQCLCVWYFSVHQ